MTEILPPPPQRRKARASLSNAAGRFDMTRDAIDDGWGDLRDSVPDQEDMGLPRIETDIRHEVARSLISYNKSPDLPFDRSINTYRGCEHGCIYCFARPSHAYLGLSPGLDFETRLIARPNAAEVLRRELSQPRYRVAPIAIGTNTDPYQPCERDLGLTRACLEVLEAFSHPVAIVTKGTLIERDLDILSAMATRGLVRVGISVTTLDADLSRRMEPRAPSPARRLATIRRLSQAGVPVRIMTSPIVPGLTDHELEALLAAGAEAGADAASWIMLRLPREVSELWQEWLAEHVPLRAEKVMARLREMHGGRDYDPRWGHRMRGEGPYAEVIANRFKTACKRLELLQKSPDLRCDLFAKPAQAGDQLALF
ncbi:PA0069 family radical SAM protein [Phaeobacter piscinae]|uniref:Radical SAM domain-containing protein n=1 Tax=Phaeobacter piscinae TaxID=1580596 RepID=A0ABM6PCK7_9RHOB|nr:PA0069 family radical SAM protein [Phaeobacter piscinae]ATG35405.1 radical SAM domain-containing protein [Phaeobacter piscinae]AUQ85925.1 radical SAM domain-containing protein [Phaeobacter piscinae]